MIPRWPLLSSLVLLVGCTSVQTVPERPNCSLTLTNSTDGLVTLTQTETYDAEFRMVSRVQDVVDSYAQTETWTYGDPDSDCITEQTFEQVGDGWMFAQTQETTCDANGDPVERTSTRSQPGRDDRVTEIEWDRAYDDNGLTSRVEITSVDDRNGEVVYEDLFSYDKKDRQIRSFRTTNEGTSLSTTVWFDELRADDLPAAEEERDATGFLSDATYTTYDDYGRPIQVRTLTNGVESILSTVWEEGRRVVISTERVRGDLVVHAVEVETSNEEPPVERTLFIDDADGVVDGVVDRTQHEVWTCP